MGFVGKLELRMNEFAIVRARVVNWLGTGGASV